MATNRLSSSPTTVTVTSPSSGLPAWLPGPGQYANASTATPRKSPVNTGPGPWNGSGDFAAIWAVWNGGAYAPTLGAYGSMLFFGGGHFSYHGNEVVRLDLETRSWSQHSQRSTRIVDTRQSGDNDSTNVAVNEYGEWADGTPYPPHTNMAVEFLPPDAGGGALGSFVFFGHDQTGIRVTVKGHLWKLDLATRNWARIPLSSANWVKDDIMACAYDPNRKGLWLHGRVGATGGPYYFIDTRNGNAVHEVYQSWAGRQLLRGWHLPQPDL